MSNTPVKAMLITVLFCWVFSLHVRISRIEEYLNKNSISLCENVNDIGPCVKGIK